MYCIFCYRNLQVTFISNLFFLNLHIVRTLCAPSYSHSSFSENPLAQELKASLQEKDPYSKGVLQTSPASKYHFS